MGITRGYDYLYLERGQTLERLALRRDFYRLLLGSKATAAFIESNGCQQATAVQCPVPRLQQTVVNHLSPVTISNE